MRGLKEICIVQQQQRKSHELDFLERWSSDRSIDLGVLEEARPKQLFFGIIMRHNNVTENDDANP